MYTDYVPLDTSEWNISRYLNFIFVLLQKSFIKSAAGEQQDIGVFCSLSISSAMHGKFMQICSLRPICEN